MAKSKHFIALNQMTKKQKIIHFLKIFGISFASVLGLIAGSVFYVWATGGFNAVYVPLTDVWHFSQDEYVIDGNSEILLDEDGNQLFDENGKLVFGQKKDQDDNLIYESILIVPNEGCTELDAVVTLSSSDVIQFVEDNNVKGIRRSNENEDDNYTQYNVKINTPIYLRPVKDENEINNGGWVKVTAEHGHLITLCWVFVDIPVESMTMQLYNLDDFEITTDSDNNEIYNVYGGSQFYVSNTINPTDSMILPTTDRTSNFNLKKTINYEVSDEEIATIDANGKVIVNPGKRETQFSITSYIVSKYNEIDKIPSQQDFVDNPSQSSEELYKRALNKMIVRSNTLNFYVKSYTIDSLEVQKIAEPDFNVFDVGSIKFLNANEITETTENVNYSISIGTSGEVDNSTLKAITSQVKIKAFYEGEIVEPVEIKKLEDITIKDNGNNYHKLVEADDYIYLENIDGIWKYVVKQALGDNKFYLVFYYENEDSVIWDYVSFVISETKVDDISITKNSIYITYNEDYEYIDYKNRYTLKNLATVTPEKPTYTSVLYFVETDDIVEVYDAIKVKNSNKQYYAVAAKVDNEVYDNLTLAPKGNVGTTNLYAIVLKTIPVIENGEILDYIYLENGDGTIQFEHISDPVIVDVSRDIEFGNIEVVESDNVNVEEYEIDGSKVSAQIYEGGKIALKFTYDGDGEYLNSSKFKISLIEGGDADVASIVNQYNDVENMTYYFFVAASKKIGATRFQVIYPTFEKPEGDAFYEIYVEVLSTTLVATTLSAQDSTITVSFDVDELNKATDYYWNDFEIDVEFNSPKTDVTTFELVVYKLPNEFNTDWLEYYEGKEFTQIISEIDNENFNSIQKLVSWLDLNAEENDVITLDNSNEPQGDAFIKYNDTNIAAYSFVGLGKVLMFASSIGMTLYSNPILIEVSIPEITIKYGIDGLGTNAKSVVSYGMMESVNETASAARKINLYLSDNDAITFWTTIDDVDIELGRLVSFRFVNQSEDNGVLTSIKSGAKIDGDILTLCEINKNCVENIVAYSNFGYVEDEFYIYTLIPNYKLTYTNSNKVYYAPSYVDLFGGSADDMPDIYITNYDYILGTVTDQNRLYLPVDYTDVEGLAEKFPQDFLNDFLYSDNEDEEAYYHIYCIVSYGNANTNTAGVAEYIEDENKLLISFTEVNKSVSVNINVPVKPYISVTPGVEKGFGDTDGYWASELTTDQTYNLSNVLTFADKTAGGDNYNVAINKIEFAVTSLTDEDLLFYKNGSDKVMKSYAPVGDEDYRYITDVSYESLSTEEKVGYKYYYIKTEDSVFDSSKKYYMQSNGQFEDVAFEDLDINNKNLYYERVYSKESYYSKVEPYYIEIDYKKTSDTSISVGKKYYIKNEITDKFEEVTNPSNEKISQYYEYDKKTSADYVKQYYIKNANGNYELATSYNDQVTYYHKHNYTLIAEGKDIAGDIYYEYLITLTNISNDIILKVDKEINTIENSIVVLFDLRVKISCVDGAEYFYSNYYYKLTFKGYND